MELLWFWKVSFAVVGKLKVTRRLSAFPAVVDVKLASGMLAQLTDRLLSTDFVTPVQP
jgi:hypothetical protein